MSKTIQHPRRQRVTKRASSGSSIRRISPTCQLPTESTLRSLTDEQRAMLEEVLSQPQECVYHTSFRRNEVPGDELDMNRPLATVDNVNGEASVEPSAAIAVVQPTELLSAEQERQMFLRFNYCRNRVLRILRQYRGKRLTAAGTRELLKWHEMAMQTRTEIVRANTSLVLAMARRSRNSGVEISELISEGNLALLRCVDKFDASRGFKFSTYACRAILASFSRAGAKSARYRTQFPATYDPALERSDYLEVRREDLEHECVNELKRILFENAADLSPVERRVLDARFSLDRIGEQSNNTRRKTLDQVGNLLGVSKERVRQIQNQAMGKIRAALEDRLLAAS